MFMSEFLTCAMCVNCVQSWMCDSLLSYYISLNEGRSISLQHGYSISDPCAHEGQTVGPQSSAKIVEKLLEILKYNVFKQSLKLGLFYNTADTNNYLWFYIHYWSKIDFSKVYPSLGWYNEAGIERPVCFADLQMALKSKGLMINTNETETVDSAKTNQTLMIRDKAEEAEGFYRLRQRC